ncbi:hypothetical protein [Sporosarcina sp. UB5]
MIIQNTRQKLNERKTKINMMEWESPKWIDVKSGGTTGERRL